MPCVRSLSPLWTSSRMKRGVPCSIACSALHDAGSAERRCGLWGAEESGFPLATCLRLGEERACFMRDARSEVRGGRCEREKGRTSPRFC